MIHSASSCSGMSYLTWVYDAKREGGLPGKSNKTSKIAVPERDNSIRKVWRNYRRARERFTEYSSLDVRSLRRASVQSKRLSNNLFLSHPLRKLCSPRRARTACVISPVCWTHFALRSPARSKCSQDLAVTARRLKLKFAVPSFCWNIERGPVTRGRDRYMSWKG